jgi:hypothetical protein
MNDFIKNLGASIDVIADEAMTEALDLIDDEDDLDAVNECFYDEFDMAFTDWLVACMKETGMTAQAVVEQLNVHRERLTDIIGVDDIDAWLENFVDTYTEEAA